MITIECDSDRSHVLVTFNRDGAEVLIRHLSELLEAESGEHVHLFPGPYIFRGKEVNPELHPISLEKDSTNPDFSVVRNLSLFFKK